ncbi:MAG: aldehyde dehydrogenase [Marmoricola sp.]|nr:aldehyde dehydrogenase [Marmoricola sp.]
MTPERAGLVLEQARWAARAFETYDAASVSRIVEATAEAADLAATKYAEWAVRETGMGVVADKVAKNKACSSGLVDEYRNRDFVSPRLDPDRRVIELPRPAGVVLGVVPTTNPVASIYFKVLLCLMTRNAIVIAPHPRAKDCSVDAARLLAAAAEAAGAPRGVIQVLEEPSIPIMEALMSDPRTDVILATGGSAVVRAAYSSGNPALSVGPGNVPTFIDASADLPAAVREILASKAFDNSVLCTNESVLVVERSVGPAVRRELQRAGAAILDGEDGVRLRRAMFDGGNLNPEVIGRDATWIAQLAGVSVPRSTRVLVVPFAHVVDEELMTHEKLSPVLGLVEVDSVAAAFEACRAVVSIGGAGHSASIHTEDPRMVMDFAARVPVLRLTVNVGNSAGSSGLTTGLAPSMTLGTGFMGGSSLGANLQPSHLVNWTACAYATASVNDLEAYRGLNPWRLTTGGPVPPWPVASNLHEPELIQSGAHAGVSAALIEQIRRLVVEELEGLVGGAGSG